jgi:hypothetical protein
MLDPRNFRYRNRFLRLLWNRVLSPRKQPRCDFVNRDRKCKSNEQSAARRLRRRGRRFVAEE